jgi:hypothetical protein
MMQADRLWVQADRWWRWRVVEPDPEYLRARSRRRGHPMSVDDLAPLQRLRWL